ncbi:MAG TPA: hypothetical protein VGS11_10975, partial [Candidatus Bathyarchaeia archaeon]|nr:hypothetical protein [Candidatus Bathyarchaeia archaeon]
MDVTYQITNAVNSSVGPANGIIGGQCSDKTANALSIVNCATCLQWKLRSYDQRQEPTREETTRESNQE